LFTLVINVLMVYLASLLVAGFSLDSFLSGLFFAIVLSLVNSFFGTLKRK